MIRTAKTLGFLRLPYILYVPADECLDGDLEPSNCSLYGDTGLAVNRGRQVNSHVLVQLDRAYEASTNKPLFSPSYRAIGQFVRYTVVLEILEAEKRKRKKTLWSAQRLCNLALHTGFNG